MGCKTSDNANMCQDQAIRAIQVIGKTPREVILIELVMPILRNIRIRGRKRTEFLALATGFL